MVKSQRNSQRMLRIFPTTNHKPPTYLGESLTPMKCGIDLTLQTISGKFIGSKSLKAIGFIAYHSISYYHIGFNGLFQLSYNINNINESILDNYDHPFTIIRSWSCTIIIHITIHRINMIIMIMYINYHMYCTIAPSKTSTPSFSPVAMVGSTPRCRMTCATTAQVPVGGGWTTQENSVAYY